MTRPIKIEVDLHSLKKNFFIAQKFAPHSRHFAVIKANAYGHGQMRVAKSLKEAGTHGFALLQLDDALLLRQANLKHQILLLEGLFNEKECLPAIQHEIDFVIHHEDQLKFLESFEVEYLKNDSLKNKQCCVFLKINTGMNRLGVLPNQVIDLVERIRKISYIKEIVLMTHFAFADEVEGVQAQMEVIDFIKNEYYHRFKTNPSLCLANSASLLRYPETHYDWVRPGIMLYGSSPFADKNAEQLGLRPVMTFSSEIISIQTIKAGERVGYGGTFQAETDMQVGIVACGYADGYPRHAPNGTPILVENVRTKLVGRVSMDMLCVDVTHIPNVHVGSQVVLWGKGLPIELVSDASKTISYELMCGITKRVKGYEYP